MGLGVVEDATQLPKEKGERAEDIFPWGATWPPPENSGNYFSDELLPVLAAGHHSWAQDRLPGYHDGYSTTAPVGHYVGNRFGIFDLGGNAWEWCEDFFDITKSRRVLRGAAWSDGERKTLRAGSRLSNEPSARYSVYGFRCVLAPAAAP